MEYITLIKSRQDTAHVQIVTAEIGNLVIELNCGKAPKACEYLLETLNAGLYTEMETSNFKDSYIKLSPKESDKKT